MPVKDFVKTRDGDLDGQEENFVDKLPVIAPTIGIDAAEVTSVVTILGDHRTTFSAMLSKKAESKAAVADNKLKKNLAIDEFRRIAKKIKASTGYTEAIGDELGIIGPEVETPPLEEMKPNLKAEVSGGVIEIKWDKQGMEAIAAYSKRGSEVSFSFFDKDVESPLIDDRPKLNPDEPEERSYYAYYLDDNENVGQQSDIITVIVP